MAKKTAEKPAAAEVDSPKSDPFTAYARLWVFTHAVHHFMQPFLIPSDGWLKNQCMIFAFAAVLPRRFIVALAMIECALMFAVQAPAVWSQCWWMMQTDFVLAGAMLLCPQDEVIPTCADLIRRMMGMFYVGYLSSFWVRLRALGIIL